MFASIKCFFSVSAMRFLHIFDCTCIPDISADRNVWPRSATVCEYMEMSALAIACDCLR